MSGRRRILPRLVAAVLLSVALVAGLGWYTLLRPTGTTADKLVVEPGTPTGVILERLKDEGLLPSVLAARLYLELRAARREPRFGHYRFDPGMRPIDVLEQILAGGSESIELTIIEGLDADAIVAQCVAVGLGDADAWQRALGRTDLLAALAPRAQGLEGFLFPETYRFSKGMPAERVAKHMVDRFRRVWLEETAAAPDPWGTPLEVVTLASLVEAETALPEERPRIAAVFLNRLNRGMLLQCDPTVVYALKRMGIWEGRLLRTHWQVDHPYNTYRYPGLPPGPIGSPGRAALRAALSPAATNELYFVARPGGGHAFSRTLAEHNRAVARLRRARR